MCRCCWHLLLLFVILSFLSSFSSYGPTPSLHASFSSIVGGQSNSVSPDSTCGFAVGYRAKATHTYAAVLGFDFSKTSASPCTSNGANSVSICASGGLFLNGVQVNPSGGASDELSDLEDDVSELRTDMNALTTDVAALTIDVTALTADVSELRIDVSNSARCVRRCVHCSRSTRCSGR